MKLRTMRLVDYWIGIPLCFLFTLVVRLMGTPKGPEKPRRVLFIELSEMGSTIIANPALQKAKDALGAEIFFLIFAAERGESPPDAHGSRVQYRHHPRDGRDGMLVLDSLRFLRWARKAKIDTVVDMELFSRYSGLLTGLSGARRRVGFHKFRAEGLYRGEMLTHRVSHNSQYSYGEELHLHGQRAARYRTAGALFEDLHFRR